MPIARACPSDESYQSYLVARLERSLQLAESAISHSERLAHLRACRHYCELLGNAHQK